MATYSLCSNMGGIGPGKLYRATLTVVALAWVHESISSCTRKLGLSAHARPCYARFDKFTLVTSKI